MYSICELYFFSPQSIQFCRVHWSVLCSICWFSKSLKKHSKNSKIINKWLVVVKCLLLMAWLQSDFKKKSWTKDFFQTFSSYNNSILTRCCRHYIKSLFRHSFFFFMMFFWIGSSCNCYLHNTCCTTGD